MMRVIPEAHRGIVNNIREINQCEAGLQFYPAISASLQFEKVCLNTRLEYSSQK